MVARLPAELRDRTNARLQIPRILWGAMFVSTVLFLVVARVAAPAGQVPQAVMLYAMAGAAAMSAVMSFVMPAKLLRHSLLAAKLEVTEEGDPTAPSALRSAAPTVRVFADPDRALQRALGVYQTAFIVGLALSESVAIFGLILGFVGFPLLQYIGFFVASWALIAIRFPTVDRVAAPLEQAYDARLARP